MHILIATDAWLPQVNGVVTTLLRTRQELKKHGVRVTFLTPDSFTSVSMPGYREIKLALARVHHIADVVDDVDPDWIHISTEGPIGWATRRYCMSGKRPFTTSYHTKFPEYAASNFGLPEAWVYEWEKRFHGPSAGVMVATPSLEKDLQTRGFSNLMRWSRGVDINAFTPMPERLFGKLPVFLYVGRVSREKNIEDFLNAPLPGRKVVVGDGPHLSYLRKHYRNVLFTGMKKGDDLARHYASADVFVFPSRSDTFGLVIIEAMASGLPVAAYPVTGPIDIVEHGISGFLCDDLAEAARSCLQLTSAQARARAAKFTWQRSAKQFIKNIERAKFIHDTRCASQSRFYPSRTKSHNPHSLQH